MISDEEMKQALMIHGQRLTGMENKMGACRPLQEGRMDRIEQRQAADMVRFEAMDGRVTEVGVDVKELRRDQIVIKSDVSEIKGMLVKMNGGGNPGKGGGLNGGNPDLPSTGMRFLKYGWPGAVAFLGLLGFVLAVIYL